MADEKVDHAQVAVEVLAAVTDQRAALAARGGMEPNVYRGFVDAIELDLKAAHVLAMLAVAEQQRIANLIALLGKKYPNDSGMWSPPFHDAVQTEVYRLVGPAVGYEFEGEVRTS